MMAIETTAGDSPILREAGAGDVIWAMGNRFTLKLRSAETAGALSMQEVVAPAGTAPPLHTHHREAEVFVLYEGRMIYRAGDETFELTPGSSIYLPRGVAHTFRVVGADPARFLALTFPGGLENLYEEIGRPAPGPGLPDPPTPEEIAAWLQTSPKYGLELNGPPLPEAES
jgi:quercetin dioxygenase-like cupin family protein